jgi:hypothetical protein
MFLLCFFSKCQLFEYLRMGEQFNIDTHRITSWSLLESVALCSDPRVKLCHLCDIIQINTNPALCNFFILSIVRKDFSLLTEMELK